MAALTKEECEALPVIGLPAGQVRDLLETIDALRAKLEKAETERDEAIAALVKRAFSGRVKDER